MPFEDEIRSRPAGSLAKRAGYLADIDQFIVEHENLITRRRRDASAIRSLETELASSQRETIKLRAETKSLRKEITTLKATLSALRRSKRMRIGSAVVAPAQALARLWLRKDSRLPMGLDGLTRVAAKAPPSVGNRAATITPPSTPAAFDPSRPNSSLSPSAAERAEELRKTVSRDPSKANVYNLIAHLFFVLGSVREPARVISAYTEVLTELSAKQKQLIDAVMGLERLSERPPKLPPKQDSPGYQAERGRILYCAHSVSPYNSNGYSTRTAGLVQGLTQAGADVIIAARPGYPWDIKTDVAPRSTSSYSETIDGINHWFSQGPTWTQGPLDYYVQEAADSYVQAAMRNRVERIHAASNHVTALPALIAARRLGLPFSYEVRGLWEITEASTKEGWDQSDRFRFSKEMETLVAAESDLVFAITGQVRDELVHRGVPAGKIVILPNAVDTDEFSDMPPHGLTKRHLGIDHNIPVIGYAGSIVEYEGLTTLLEACHRMVAEETEFRLVIVGDGAALPALKAQAASLGLSDVTTFTGRVKASEIPNYLSVFDITPCPRLPLPVTEMVSPIKPLEAMAAAKAVVLSDLPPLRDLAGADGERANLFPAGDAVQLASVLTELVKNEDLRRAMGRRARLWAISERNWRRVGEEAGVALSRSEQPASSICSTNLSDVTIGIIADEFTTAGMRPDISLIELLPDTWGHQLAESKISALFVESAWDGNGGAWRGKVGYYDDDSFANLRDLLSHCRANSIPTIFWNKEDPVHFNRFQKTASYFQHVFTSDDRSIRRYLESAGEFLESVASLPFYAQPALHNPLPSARAYSHTVSYAGSYYGARYEKRSDQLHSLLAAAIPAGLTIYDRQHLNPQSPYKFPPDLAPYVSGGLTYTDMVQAYKAHPVHINVNSVEQSGTMFSRRVFEVAACGGAIVSGPGQGIDQVFGSIIPLVSDQPSAQNLIKYWMENEEARNEDAWLAMRSVFRSHTAAHRLTYVLRTAGLRVKAPTLEKYALRIQEITPEIRMALAAQSVRPTLLLDHSDSGDALAVDGIEVRRMSPDDSHSLLSSGITLIGDFPTRHVDRTYYEDLLTSRKYSAWDSARISQKTLEESGRGLARVEINDGSGMYDLMSLRPTGGQRSLLLSRRVVGDRRSNSPRAASAPKRILIAGHDLKFARGLIAHLEAAGHTVELDQWLGHAQHDEESSRAKLENVDVIFCEWTLGNAVWFANNKRPDQRLVCRLHLQELSTSYLHKLNMENVDSFIFVGRHTAKLAQRDFGVPAKKAVIIPNYVAIKDLSRNKTPGAQWNLGLVGIVPQRKRIDLALDVFRELRMGDKRYHLFIKGKRPEDFPWMAERPEELSYYQEQYARIESDPMLVGAVTFDPHGDDMSRWYQKIGTVLSVSDFESFHLTLADGAASRALPVTLGWAGADQIYPASWIFPTVKALANFVASATSDATMRKENIESAAEYVRNNFDEKLVLNALQEVVLGQ
ncbi:glycosyltransferase [Arthrobacter sp. CAL618]|uniref:glycosyltransferase n=1 Tax=Arthrobacter sp. CAL618 TaxID=1055770 RepID=UPI00041A1643|nr:glycosyltransferase [Arthrobacter sp. CAL618]